MLGRLKSESQHVEYDFDTDSGGHQVELRNFSSPTKIVLDYHRFQELIMGHNIHLNFHRPIQKVTFRKTGALKSTHDCEAQVLRVWKYQSKQTMMFYANIAETYREYDCK